MEVMVGFEKFPPDAPVVLPLPNALLVELLGPKKPPVDAAGFWLLVTADPPNENGCAVPEAELEALAEPVLDPNALVLLADPNENEGFCWLVFPNMLVPPEDLPNMCCWWGGGRGSFVIG